MKYIRLYEDFKDKSVLESELDSYRIKNYSINDDLMVMLTYILSDYVKYHSLLVG